MENMFWKCSALNELDLSNFNTDNVLNMGRMFYQCASLKELNISNFNILNPVTIYGMFLGCSKELKKKIRNQFQNIRKEAFENY